MLSVFDPALSKLVPVGDGALPSGGWLHLEVPTEDELQRVVAIGLPEELMTHALDEDELARIAHWPDSWSLVVLRVPRVAEADDSVPFRATTLAVLVKDDRAITVSRRPSELVNRLMRMVYGNYLSSSGSLFVGDLDVARALPRQIIRLRRD